MSVQLPAPLTYHVATLTTTPINLTANTNN
ncbi:hypothetical protein BH10CHL1_BH10CHL1_45720 [soil metagenome]